MKIGVIVSGTFRLYETPITRMRELVSLQLE